MDSTEAFIMHARRSFLVAILLTVPLAVAAPGNAPAQQGPRNADREIVVRSQANDPVRVYALQQGHMVPLGLVPEGANPQLDLPPFFLDWDDPVPFVLDAIGSSDWSRTDPVTVQSAPGIDLLIAGDLSSSTVSVDSRS